MIFGTTANIVYDVLSQRLPEKTWGLNIIETPVDEDDEHIVPGLAGVANSQQMHRMSQMHGSM